MPSRLLRAVPAAMLLLFVAGCGDPLLDPPKAPQIVVGAGDSVESELLAHVYAGALARSGLEVDTELGLGDRAAVLSALDSGGVTLVADTTGALLRHLNPTATETAPKQVFDALNRALPTDLAVADYAAAQSGPVLVVPESIATQLAEPTIEALAPRCGELVLGYADSPVPAGCAFGGQRRYQPDELAPALRNGEVQAAVVDSSAAGVGVTLTDAFPAENVVPLFRTGILTTRQTVQLNVVAGELLTADLAELVDQVRAGRPSADVARGWLDAHGV